MPDFADIQLGDLTLSVRWPVTITPPPRQITSMANALSEGPVQVTDYISDYGTIAFEAKLEGIETRDETAGDCLKRLSANLLQTIANAGGLDPVVFSDQLSAESEPTVLTCYKSPPPARIDDWAADRKHVRFYQCTLRYL